MKRFVAIGLSILILLPLMACSSSSQEDRSTISQSVTEGSDTDASTEELTEETEEDIFKAALLLNGYLGDKSFFDSAKDGLDKLKEELGDSFAYTVEEMGETPEDAAQWEETLMEYSQREDYDVIICGSSQMAESLAKVAAQYPDQKYIYFDETFDYDTYADCENVYNVMFKQNEVAFLVGSVAAIMTGSSSYNKVDSKNALLGFVGGQEGEVINDFLVGYLEGAQYINPDIKVFINYVGDYSDTDKAQELAEAQYEEGVDIIFNVAGSAGLGTIEAAVQKDRYVVGVDSDQAALLPKYAEYIPTSALKNVGNAIYRAIKLDLDDALTYGETETLGFSEGGVELAVGENYESLITEADIETLKEIEEKVISGDIKVDSAYDMSEEELEEMMESVQVQ